MSQRDMERELEAVHPACYGWALACCDWDKEEAREVLQVSYLKALDGRARFDRLSSLRTWFFGVVKRTAAERRRNRFARSLGLGRWLSRRPAPRPVPTPETLSHDAEDRRRLRRLLAGLTPRQRDLLHLVFYQELTIDEAARVLEISLGTARTHYERGKARLRNLLLRAEEDDEPRRENRATASRTVYGG
jgi:RNA polymerase sigma factor (sigma-70 family)